MISLAEARRVVLDAVGPLPVVQLAPGDAIGCVVAEPVLTPGPMPPFDNSAVDGFALRAADTVGGSEGAPVGLRISGTIAAGADPVAFPVATGTAVRIMTGAAMPAGADAVVMVERTQVADGGEVVEVAWTAAPGDNIRRAGDDLGAGDVVVGEGIVLTAGHVGLLAGAGFERVAVVRRPRVGVLSTGDELVQGPGALRPGQIRETNRLVLLPLVTEAGCDAVDLGVVADEEGPLTATLERAAQDCDAVVTTGGVSMGDFDFVKVVLDRLGEMHWMRIAIKPAKPFAFGSIGERRVPVFGLPGNPVSAVVSFELLARPALRKMLGHRGAGLDRLRARATAADGFRRRPDGKMHFVRVVATYDDGRYHVRSAGGQGSHQLSALATANALVVLPDGTGAAPGDEVEMLVLGEVRTGSPLTWEP
ncbi:MAG: molybdopterin molybdotransferase MoeA [Acidimicrobiia bacterium]